MQEQMRKVLETRTCFVANVLEPTEGEALQTSFVDGKNAKLVVPTLVGVYVSATRGSIEHRVLCTDEAYLNSCPLDRKIVSMLHKLGEHGDYCTCADVGAGMERDEGGVSEGGEGCRSMEDGEDSGVVSHGTKVASSPTRYGVIADNCGPRRKKWKLTGGLRTTMIHGRTDWVPVLAVGTIPRGKFSRKTGDDNKIKHVLR